MDLLVEAMGCLFPGHWPRPIVCKYDYGEYSCYATLMLLVARHGTAVQQFRQLSEDNVWYFIDILDQGAFDACILRLGGLADLALCSFGRRHDSQQQEDESVCQWLSIQGRVNDQFHGTHVLYVQSCVMRRSTQHDQVPCKSVFSGDTAHGGCEVFLWRL